MAQTARRGVRAQEGKGRSCGLGAREHMEPQESTWGRWGCEEGEYRTAHENGLRHTEERGDAPRGSLRPSVSHLPSLPSSLSPPLFLLLLVSKRAQVVCSEEMRKVAERTSLAASQPPGGAQRGERGEERRGKRERE